MLGPLLSGLAQVAFWLEWWGLYAFDHGIAWLHPARSVWPDARSLYGLATLSGLLNLVGVKRSQGTSQSLVPGAAATGGNDD